MPAESPRPRQLPLPLPAIASAAAADLVPDASNAAALAFLADPLAWPAGRLALHGPSGTGKSHMLRVAAARRGWRLLPGHALDAAAALAPAAGTALDDADAAPEAALFHLINRAAEQRAPLLLAARAAPARWPVALPDLASRLRATHAVAIAAPSDALCAALLAKLLADRQIEAAPGFQAWLLARLPRDGAALAEAVARLDAAALAAGGPLSRALARASLPGLAPDDDGCGSASPGGSPSAPAVG